MLLLCHFVAVCNMNVHKRCQKNVANNCGINTKEMAQILAAMGISTDKLGPPPRKPNKVSCTSFCLLLIHFPFFTLIFFVDCIIYFHNLSGYYIPTIKMACRSLLAYLHYYASAAGSQFNL